MGKRDVMKKRPPGGTEIRQPVSKEKTDSAILSGRRGSAISLLLIATVALLIYSNTFTSPFHFDDKDNIIDNYQIRGLSNLWPPSGMRYIGYLSFALNYYFGGLDVYSPEVCIPCDPLLSPIPDPIH